MFPFFDSFHPPPFAFFPQEKGRQGKRLGGELITALGDWCLPVSFLILKSFMLTLIRPPFLLAGQSLYYGDKSMNVCAGEPICVSDKESTNLLWLHE